MRFVAFIIWFWSLKNNENCSFNNAILIFSCVSNGSALRQYQTDSIHIVDVQGLPSDRGQSFSQVPLHQTSGVSQEGTENGMML